VTVTKVRRACPWRVLVYEKIPANILLSTTCAGSVSGGIFIFTIGGLVLAFMTVLLEVIYQRKFVVARARRTARNMFGPPDPAPGGERSSAKKKKKHATDAKDDSKKVEKNKADTIESKINEKNKPNTNGSKQPTVASIKKSNERI
jgi:hypothetical protein